MTDALYFVVDGRTSESAYPLAREYDGFFSREEALEDARRMAAQYPSEEFFVFEAKAVERVWADGKTSIVVAGVSSETLPMPAKAKAKASARS